MAQQVKGTTPFSIDPGNDLPVGLQLSWRLRALIVTGQLAAGEKLPSFRQLAGWAGVNVNTVRAAYASLEDEGLVVTRQGHGTFVGEGVEAAPDLEAIVGDALRRADELGLSRRELAIVAAACAGIKTDSGLSADPATEALPPSDESEAIEVRHELRRQISRLEAELASYTRDLSVEMRTAHRRAQAHVSGVEELEETRDTLIAQLSEAQRAAERRVREEAQANTRRRAAAGLGGGSATGGPEEGPLARAMSWWRDRS